MDDLIKYLENNKMLHRYNDYFIKDKYTIKELINDIDNNKNVLYKDKHH